MIADQKDSRSKVDLSIEIECAAKWWWRQITLKRSPGITPPTPEEALPFYNRLIELLSKRDNRFFLMTTNEAFTDDELCIAADDTGVSFVHFPVAHMHIQAGRVLVSKTPSRQPHVLYRKKKKSPKVRATPSDSRPAD